MSFGIGSLGQCRTLSSRRAGKSIIVWQFRAVQECCMKCISRAAVAAALFCTAVVPVLVRAEDQPGVLADVPGASSDPADHNGFSRPSVEHKLMFTLPGLIRDIPTKLGDMVKENQVLATLDDDIEQKELERLK